MELLFNPSRKYQRHNYRNRYDEHGTYSPLKILVFIIKLIPLFSLLAVITYFGLRAAQNWHVPRITEQSFSTDSIYSVATTSFTETQTSAPAPTPVALASKAREPVVHKPLTDKIFEVYLAQFVGEEWILDQDPNDFIIQYASSANIEELRQFAAVINTEIPLAIFQFKTSATGTPVYGLASGLYSDLDTALSFVDQLPVAAKAHGPWVRPINSLKEQIVTLTQSSG